MNFLGVAVSQAEWSAADSASPPASPPVGAADDEARTVLADSLRHLIAATTTAGADADFRAARDHVDAALAALGAVPSVDDHRLETQGGRRPTLNPFDSAGNPLAPPLRVTRSAGGEYTAEFTLSPAYEGPPGRAHGGVVAGILDHASGFALRSEGIIALSVSLEISLRDATPYGEVLTVTARAGEREGRKIWVNASLAAADGREIASCRTLMIELAAPPEWAALATGN
jgi:acyl-coenzyme A thioesterase PaaI-like protein